MARVRPITFTLLCLIGLAVSEHWTRTKREIESESDESNYDKRGNVSPYWSATQAGRIYDRAIYSEMRVVIGEENQVGFSDAVQDCAAYYSGNLTQAVEKMEQFVLDEMARIMFRTNTTEVWLGECMEPVEGSTSVYRSVYPREDTPALQKGSMCRMAMMYNSTAVGGEAISFRFDSNLNTKKNYACTYAVNVHTDPLVEQTERDLISGTTKLLTTANV